VSLGPGGFTSTRIGVVAACTFARSLSVGVRPVPTTQVAAHAHADRRIGVALAIKNSEAWYARFEHAKRITEDTSRRIDTLRDEPIDALLVPARSIEAFREFQTEITVQPMALSANALLHAAATVLPVDPVEVRPIYPRRADALTIAERDARSRQAR